MQRLALMMAVMMLGMPPVSSYHTSVGPGEQGTRNQAESMFPPLCVVRQQQGNPGGKGSAQPPRMEARLWSRQPSGSCSKFNGEWKVW